MKKTSKLLALLLAFVMAFAVVAPVASAADVEETAKTTNTVTLHKLLMSKEMLDQWNSEDVQNSKTAQGTDDGYNGSQDLNALGQITKVREYLGENGTLKEIAGVYFAWQKYDDDAKVWKYIKNDGSFANQQDPTKADFQTEVLGGLTTDNGYKFTTEDLPAGSYRINEVTELSTYIGKDEDNKGSILAGQKAVPVEITLPLVNKDGVVENAHVYPKNTETKPQIDKNFLQEPDNATEEQKKFYENLTEDEKKELGADYDKYLAEKEKVSQDLGTVIPYDVITSIKAGSRYQTLNWKDTMTNGLTYNKDLEIEAKYTDADGQSQTLMLTKDDGSNNGDYTLTEDDRGFTLSFTEAGFTKLNAITHPAEGTGFDVEFKLTYSATINKNAVVDTPEKNDIKLEYSNEKDKEVDDQPVTPSNGELTVNKNWADGESSEVPSDVQVVYTVIGSNGITASVMLDGTEVTDKEFDLGNGIKFTVTGQYTGKFTGLTTENNVTWTIRERVAGYNEEYTGTNTDGQVTIKNTKDNENPEPLNPTEPQVEYYGKKFVKADQDTGARLEGAQFVVTKQLGDKTVYLALKSDANTENERTALTNAKNAYTTAVDAYNKAVANNESTVTIGTTQYTISGEGSENTETGNEAAKAAIAALKVAYEAAFYAAANAYEWVEDQNATNLVVLVSDVNGKFEIKGLEAGTYKLVEIKAPEGYALPTNAEFEFTVGPNSYTTGDVKYDSPAPVGGDVENPDAQRVNNKKVTIPPTGSIGTIIFTVAGLAIMVAAGFVLVKNNKKEEIA